MSFNVNGGNNYISDGELMAWLANQQDRIYGELSASMDLAEERASATSDLTDIKLHLEQANTSRNFDQVNAELQAFLSNYGDAPELAELCETVGGIAARINADWSAREEGYAKACGAYYAERQSYDDLVDRAAAGDAKAAVDLLERRMPVEPTPPTLEYSPEDIKSWTNAIDGKIDVSGKNDQLTMIHIQELKATLDQSTQLGSTLISGSDKALDAVINNIA